MTRSRPIIAIDGPVGAGKSTVARRLAEVLGFSYLNTGAMYRAVAVAARAAGIGDGDAETERKLDALLALRADRFLRRAHHARRPRHQRRNRLARDKRDRLAAFDAGRSARADARPAARGRRATAAVVMEGRDIGTAVFPDAEFKFFLDADAEVRADRRWRELDAQRSRDHTRGSARAVASNATGATAAASWRRLRRAPDAIVIDASGMTCRRGRNADGERVSTRVGAA